MKTEQDKTQKQETNGGRVFHGVVVGDKMQDTVVVAVTRFVKHPKYRKFIKRLKKFHVHNPGNVKKTGDKVTIRECRPISKTKRFTIVSE